MPTSHLHAPLLPLYKWPLNRTNLTPSVVVWNHHHQTQESCQKCYRDGNIRTWRTKEPPRTSDRSHGTRTSRQQGNSTQQTCIRSRFRVSLVRQDVFYNDLWIAPKTTISLSGNFSLVETSSPSFLSCHTRPPVRRCNISHLMDSQIFCLAMYFFFNLSLTLYNKMVLERFPFPYTLTALHALCGAVGGHILLQGGVFVSASLNVGQNLVLLAFSILYAINIIVSNLSLQLVNIPFHQVVRAATPFFTIVLSASLLGIRSSRARIISLVPVIAGVGLATYGGYDFTTCGFFLTLLGTLLAALKTILTNVLQSPQRSSGSIVGNLFPGLQLSPLDLLYRMSPLAFVHCMMFAHTSGELRIVRRYVQQQMTPFGAIALILNGALAFGLNVISFTANKKAGALSMTVAANVKQVLTILLAVAVFDLTVTLTNGLGIALTILGGVWYTMVEYQEKKQDRPLTMTA